MPKPTDPEVWLYALAGTVDYALNALDDGTLTADEALMFIRKARREYMDAAQADASAAVAAAEVPDELAPPGWTTTPGGYQVPADLDDDPALWTGEDRDRSAEDGAR
jgi:hypothetical protein